MIYDQGPGAYAARLWWMLQAYRHKMIYDHHTGYDWPLLYPGYWSDWMQDARCWIPDAIPLLSSPDP